MNKKNPTLMWLLGGNICAETSFPEAGYVHSILHQVSGNRAIIYTNFSCHATCSLQEKFRLMFNKILLPCGLRALFGLGVQLQSTVPRPHRFYAFQTKSHPEAVIPAVIAEMWETWWQTGQRSKRWSIHGWWREGKISLLHMQFVKVMTATQMHKLKSWSMSHEKRQQSAVSNAF